MKRTSIILFLFLNFFSACKKNNSSTEPDYTQFSGTWVPYESVSANGTVSQGPFTSGNIFGIYCESVKLDADKTFTPAVFNGPGNIMFKESEKGTYQYDDQRKMVLNGAFRLEFVVERIDASELWLNDQHVLLKLRKLL